MRALVGTSVSLLVLLLCSGQRCDLLPLIRLTTSDSVFDDEYDYLEYENDNDLDDQDTGIQGPLNAAIRVIPGAVSVSGAAK